MSNTLTGLTAAIERFRALLGSDAVLVDQPEKTDYNDPFPLGDPEEFAPGVVLFPTFGDQVQDIVRIANELDVPIWANSRGKNNGYGGNSPRLKGTVVVNLERMNRVLEVNEELGYAVVEPGVRFRDLYAHLQENGYKLWISVPELDWGSVIGNALERGFGYTAYGENGTKLCGQEVVLPDGELLRTGMGAQDGNKAFHLYKSGFGPSVDGLFQQSNLGIVVKSGVWLMPQPQAFAAVDVSVPEWNDLAPLADTIRELQLRGTIVGTALIGETITVAFTIDKRSRWYEGPGAAPDTLAQQVIEEFGVGRWNAWFGVYGTPERVEADIADIERAFGRIPRSDVRVTRYAGDVAANDVNFEHWTRAGIPSMHGAKMLEWREGEPGTGAHTCFSPVLPLTGAELLADANHVRELCEAYGLDYHGVFLARERYANHICELIYDGSDPAYVAGVRELFGKLLASATEKGYGEYRTHVAFMDEVSDAYDFNDHAMRRFQDALKDALDPKGILAPGKAGVWGTRAREEGWATV